MRICDFLSFDSLVFKPSQFLKQKKRQSCEIRKGSSQEGHSIKNKLFAGCRKRCRKCQEKGDKEAEIMPENMGEVKDVFQRIEIVEFSTKLGTDSDIDNLI